MTNPSTRGIPPGVVDAVLLVLKGSPVPIRRRAILEELERRGHRISLAGLNRTVDYCLRSQLTTESPLGVKLAPGTTPRP
ncbi:MAG: hypothetical protein L3K03_09525 [Thermoplasmata archaeon]|nr:hypothetical protein [Thermoplasmata archaeon]